MIARKKLWKRKTTWVARSNDCICYIVSLETWKTMCSLRSLLMSLVSFNDLKVFLFFGLKLCNNLYKNPSVLGYYFSVHFELVQNAPLYCILLMLVKHDLWECRKGCLLKNHFQLLYVVQLQTLIWPSEWQGLDFSRY